VLECAYLLADPRRLSTERQVTAPQRLLAQLRHHTPADRVRERPEDRVPRGQIPRKREDVEELACLQRPPFRSSITSASSNRRSPWRICAPLGDRAEPSPLGDPSAHAMTWRHAGSRRRTASFRPGLISKISQIRSIQTPLSSRQTPIVRGFFCPTREVACSPIFGTFRQVKYGLFLGIRRSMSRRRETEMSFAAALTGLKQERALTFRELHEATQAADPTGKGLSGTHISRLCNGAEPPSPSTIALLADALRLPPRYFAEYRLAEARALLDERGPGGLPGALRQLSRLQGRLGSPRRSPEPPRRSRRRAS
jgi:transcriptional regulator with XRE-family HTH domain